MGGPVLTPRATTPQGYIEEYLLAECSESNPSTPVAEPPVQMEVNQDLFLGSCYQTTIKFLSFQGGFQVPCPNGQTPLVTAYYSTDCTGPSVNAANLPADKTPGDCTEILPQLTGLYGQSAQFFCIAN